MLEMYERQTCFLFHVTTRLQPTTDLAVENVRFNANFFLYNFMPSRSNFVFNRPDDEGVYMCGVCVWCVH